MKVIAFQSNCFSLKYIINSFQGLNRTFKYFCFGIIKLKLTQN